MQPLSHLVTIKSFDQPKFLDFFDLIKTLKTMEREETTLLLKDKIIANIFFQPSTRTRLGFHTAAIKLGAQCIGFSSREEIRCIDYCQESLVDCIQVLGQMADAIIFRHSLCHTAAKMASTSPVPLINAGDGFNEHPVQALNDIWIAYDKLGGLANRTIGIMGDPNGRVMRSFILGVLQFGIREMLFFLPPGVFLPSDLKGALLHAKVPYQFCEQVQDLLRAADVIEVVPLALKELKKEYKELREGTSLTPYTFVLNREKILGYVESRTQELNCNIEGPGSDLYCNQSQETIFVQMAILLKYLRP